MLLLTKMSVMEDFSQLVTRIQECNLSYTNPEIAECGKFNNFVNKQVICGPYPGVDGINYKSEEDAMDNLRHLRKLGVTTFISLQKETSPQDPYSPGEVDSKFSWAFPEYISYAYLINKNKDISKDVKYYHFPMADNTVPGHKSFINNLKIILQLLLDGKKIFIHCAGGHGRTGLYVACLLITINKLCHLDALRLTQQLHDSRKVMDQRQHSTFVGSPSNPGQVKFVQHYKHFMSFFTRL